MEITVSCHDHGLSCALSLPGGTICSMHDHVQTLMSSSMLFKSGVHVQLQDLTFWQSKLGVQRAPSVVFLRGPGALSAVYDASNTKRLDIAKLIADNAWQVMQCTYVCNIPQQVTLVNSPRLSHTLSSM